MVWCGVVWCGVRFRSCVFFTRVTWRRWSWYCFASRVTLVATAVGAVVGVEAGVAEVGVGVPARGAKAEPGAPLKKGLVLCAPNWLSYRESARLATGC